ncbi:hypothetical protein [Streptomyces gobitricini]|uniref:Uncharacterized protein n=1 Tax=Streptomyces gobitricini TaxID=68211 RepID=A0ABN3L7L4_9ACTN
MVRRLLTSSRAARRLRWLLVGALCSAGAALLVTGGTLLLPGGVARSLSDRAHSGLVVGAALVLSAAVIVRARRGRPRPPR